MDEHAMIDIASPDQEVEIIVSENGQKVWVNVDGRCRLRINHNRVRTIVEIEGLQRIIVAGE